MAGDQADCRALYFDQRGINSVEAGTGHEAEIELGLVVLR
jgi:hypothetical protein